MQNRKYGWRKDHLDARDIPFMLERTPRPALPKQADLIRRLLPAAWDQGQLGSCTAHGTLMGGVYLRKRQGASDADVMPARLFEYYNTRALDGHEAQDAGGSIRNAIKAYATNGVPPEMLWPYDPAKFADKPTPDCYTVAMKDQLLTYKRIQDGDLYALKSALAAGLPVDFGFSVYKEMESPACAKGPDAGMVPMPWLIERPLGGHCVLAIGYDADMHWGDCTGFVRCRNSWGADWGQAGDFWLPFDYIGDPRLASDLWVMQSVE